MRSETNEEHRVGAECRSRVAGVVHALAEHRHGVVAHRHAMARGVTRREIQGLEWLRRWHRGVSYVGAGTPPRDAFLMAAVLAVGDDACLFGRSAAEALGLARSIEGVIHVACARGARSRRGIRVRQITLEADELDTVRDIPTTEPNRTIADLAAEATRRELERAIDQAAHDGTLSLSKLDAYAARRRPGSILLRRVLADHDPGTTITESELEELFLALVDNYGLPRPRCNVRHTLPGGRRIRIDALYADASLAIELDGRDAHTRATDFQRDRERDRGLTLQGMRPVRFTKADLTFRAGQTAKEIAALLRRD